MSVPDQSLGERETETDRQTDRNERSGAWRNKSALNLVFQSSTIKD